MTKVTFFGTSAAAPSKERGFSCIGLSDQEAIVLLDCGDGSIRNILKFGVDVRSISDILISHYHSDHVTGLTQIVETMGIRRRQSELNIFGPPGLVEYFSTVQKITNVALHRNFKINLNEVPPNQDINIGSYKCRTFEMDHTIPCLGYRLLSGTSGKIIAFTGDTQPCSSINSLGNGADLLIHEATYLERDLERARSQKHSTAKEAAQGASAAGAKRLILTHVNDDYEIPEDMLDEARRNEFSNVSVAHDGMSIEI